MVSHEEDQDPIEGVAENEDLDELNLDEAEADDENEDDAGDAAPDEEEATDSTSLEELLAQRSAARRAGEESEEEEDIMSFASEPDLPTVEPLAPVVPIKDREEFVCASCYLVKARSQLADAERGLCRDCV